MYSDRQVSRLIDSLIPNTFTAAFPDCSSGLWQKLSKHGDEIAQDLHLLPFSSAQRHYQTEYKHLQTPSALLNFDP
jgi:hypothetical protein